MVEKRSLSYLAYVSDTSVNAPSLEFVKVVTEFVDVLSIYHLGISYDRKIHSDIDLKPSNKSISISSYRMTLMELKDH